ncbi:MAG: hypothetical protein M0R80_30700 [Proteobacteria bacterium]|nr:hypothetical protein [Pseudomonadota bacterium]
MNVYATIDSGAPESVRYSMEQIENVWEGATDTSPYKPYWDTVLDEVALVYGSGTQKYNQFYSRAGNYGVIQ